MRTARRDVTSGREITDWNLAREEYTRALRESVEAGKQGEFFERVSGRGA